MRARRLLVAVLLTGLGLTGCSSADDAPPSTPVPAAADLIAASATAMKNVTSAHFTITITGTLPDVTVQQADGVLTSAGEGEGTATIVQFGQLVEVSFVVVGTDLYLKGPTGGYTSLPVSMAASVYDPTAILDPDRGVAAVLASATGLGTTTAAGDSYTVTGTVPQDVAGALAPGISSDTAATFTIAAATSYVTGVSFALTGSDGEPAAVAVALSDFNAPVTVTAPSS